MRVGIDARMIDWSGVGRYTENLIRGIHEFGPDIEPVIFCNRSNSDKIPNAVVTKKHYIDIPVFSLDAPIKLASKLRNHEFELYHAPHFVVPSGVNYPVVVTIHDLIPLIIKKTMPSILHRRYYHYLNLMACRKATKIITPSYSTKQDIVGMFGVPEDKIEVVYESVHKNFTKVGKEQVEEVKDKFAIKGNYIFALGNQKPSKGIEYLVEAFHKLTHERRDKRASKCELILTGSPSNKFKGVASRIARYNLGQNARFIGNTTDDELIALYNGASAFIFPSLYEGFGLPPLEAMACEVPVIASNKSSIPEVVGNAAITVDPHNIDELADAIARVIEDDNLRSELIERGLKRIKDFSFEKFAKETIKVYGQVYRI